MTPSDRHEAEARRLFDELESLMKVAKLPKRYDLDRLRQAMKAADALADMADVMGHEIFNLLMAERRGD